MFQYAFVLTQLYKEIKNYCRRMTNIKPFIDLYNWKGIEYAIGKNEKNYTYLKK